MALGKVEHMSFKIVGAVLIISSCICVGHIMTSSHKKTVRLMQQLIAAFAYMECELSYRTSPLPELLRNVSTENSALKRYFCVLADELEDQISPNVACCVDAALTRVNDLPELVRIGIKQFGRNAGCFDVDGQIKEIISVKEHCTSLLANYTKNEEVRLRNYRVLTLCAGTAIVILLL